MSKAVKKKSRRLWRTVRKTLGTLFLVSALVIAAIPVDHLQAINGTSTPGADVGGERDDKYSWQPECAVPSIKSAKNTSSPEVYVDKGRNLEFVYIEVPDINNGGLRWRVIITGYEGGFVEDGILTIPDTVDAYKLYDPTKSNYAAVGQNGNYLFYRITEDVEYSNVPSDIVDTNNNQYFVDRAKAGNKVLERVKVEATKFSDDGKNTPIEYKVTVKEETGNYLPCLMASKTEEKAYWEDLPDSRFYYDKDHEKGQDVPSNTDPNVKPAIFLPIGENVDYKHIRGANVDYIAKEYWNGSDWAPITEATMLAFEQNGGKGAGVFAKRTNFNGVDLGTNFQGVGNYAFYGTGITSITFRNALQTIGEGAFRKCTRLERVNLVTEGDKETSLVNICKDAFRDSGLIKFDVPWSVDTIGDRAFYGCDKLTEINLCNPGGLLEHVGLDVFNGCNALTSLTFPDSCEEPLYLSTFAGCTSLEYICARNPKMTFMDDNLVKYKNFKETMKGEFYFEGQAESELHKMCRDPKGTCHSDCKDIYFAFSYIDASYQPEGRYELTEKDKGSTAPDARSIFIVTNKNELEQYISVGTVENLTIPEKIGKYSIATIKGRGPNAVGVVTDGAFANSCTLKTVIIPSTVKEVGDYAFIGCHNLTSVIFDGFDLYKDNPDNIKIGANAFRTQEWSKEVGSRDTHVTGCGGISASGEPNAKLNFVGPISADFGPFKYAMSDGGAYSHGGQTTSYITYYTGWPYNLEVKYEDGKSVLNDFPTLTELNSYVGTLQNDGSYTGGTPAHNEALGYYYNKMAKNEQYKKALDTVNVGNPDGQFQIDLVNATLNISIPDGIKAIRDGLFYKNGEANGRDMSVTACSSLERIKAGEFTEDTDGNRVISSDPNKQGTFAGCKHLTKVELLPGSGTTAIDSHAFQDCKKLETANIADTAIAETSADGNVKNKGLGINPFYGCDKLKYVNFGTEPTRYKCKSVDDSIIYTVDDKGNFTVVVECLGGRDNKVRGEDLAGVTELWPEAFKGSRVEEVDLRQTSINTIPEEAFAETKRMTDLQFPSTLESIRANAFNGSVVRYINAADATYKLAPGLVDQKAFDGLIDENGDERDHGKVEWRCVKNEPPEEPTPAQKVGETARFDVKNGGGTFNYQVTFWDWNSTWGQDEQLYPSVSVQAGTTVPKKDIPKFRGKPGKLDGVWKVDGTQGDIFNDEYVVNRDLTVRAYYGDPEPGWNQHTVTFLDDDETKVLQQFTVDPGTNVLEDSKFKYLIPNPSKDNHVFLGWIGGYDDLKNVTADVKLIAKYRQKMEGECIVRFFVEGEKEPFATTTLIGGATVVPPAAPAREGKVFVRWAPEPGEVTRDTDYVAIYIDGNSSNGGNGTTGSGNGTNNSGNGTTGSGNGTNNPGSSTANYHTLTVQGGSGSGMYLTGAQIIVNANDPARGQEFSGWTVSPADTAVTDKTLPSMIITMPDKDVAVIANYKARTSSSTGTGSSNTTNTNRRPGSTGTVGGGTTVVIDKNGLSNTGVVSATVNGSSDNFTIKITESASATEAVLKALQAEYGSLDNLKYFPMDISLYDSTGTKKITDTTGLSVSITLPLPDSLTTYAGNNKVAGVVNDKLDKLTPKFTTINGVACVTFTAEHFSPYVIYVDITNLSDSTIADSTPKTGDGIHPKWFLSIGLACLSLVMFMAKDGRGASKKKQKVAVRARR